MSEPKRSVGENITEGKEKSNKGHGHGKGGKVYSGDVAADIASRMREVVNEFGGAAEFAKLCGLAERSSAYKWIREKRPSVPNADTLRTICERTGINAHWIVTGKPPKYRIDEPVMRDDAAAVLAAVQMINVGVEVLQGRLRAFAGVGDDEISASLAEVIAELRKRLVESSAPQQENAE